MDNRGRIQMSQTSIKHHVGTTTWPGFLQLSCPEASYSMYIVCSTARNNKSTLLHYVQLILTFNIQEHRIYRIHKCNSVNRWQECHPIQYGVTSACVPVWPWTTMWPWTTVEYSRLESRRYKLAVNTSYMFTAHYSYVKTRLLISDIIIVVFEVILLIKTRLIYKSWIAHWRIQRKPISPKQAEIIENGIIHLLQGENTTR